MRSEPAGCLRRHSGHTSPSATLASWLSHRWEKSKMGTWFLTRKGSAVWECLGVILTAPERTEAQVPKVPLERTSWSQREREARSRPAEAWGWELL